MRFLSFLLLSTLLCSCAVAGADVLLSHDFNALVKTDAAIKDVSYQTLHGIDPGVIESEGAFIKVVKVHTRSKSICDAIVDLGTTPNADIIAGAYMALPEGGALRWEETAASTCGSPSACVAMGNQLCSARLGATLIPDQVYVVTEDVCAFACQKGAVAVAVMLTCVP